MTNVSREKAKINFKKARTHIDKIISMIEDDKYCIDIMQQNLAVIGLLRSAHSMIMEGHLKGCFSDAFNSKSIKKHDEMIDEILKVTKMYNK
ncbi:MAG: Copper-sensing transcriptional repressor CsoR [Parcubacteria group bacterium GW2011_GWD2_38_11]|nr:MAG: Copper-sensing transcriptional repressor CsoR [Parcubacteria group bacterium GW2011_GWD2_38_11]